MAEKKYPVITITRQYAAYGRTVAKKLAERTGLQFYDRDLIHKAAEESGYSVEEIAAEGEDIGRGSSLLNSIMNNAAAYSSSHDRIFDAEKQVILGFARKEPCIIVGRCAAQILKEAELPAIHVLLYGAIDDRCHHALDLGEYGRMDVKRYVARKDALRETFCKVYTGADIWNVENYDICLNSCLLGPDTCVDLIEKVLEKY